MATDFEMHSGDTRYIDVTFTSEGAAISLAGATIRWGLSLSVSGEPLLEKTVGDGIVITSAPDGQFRVTISPADTEELFGRYYHEAEVTESDGTVSTVMTGKIKILNDLLRA